MKNATFETGLRNNISVQELNLWFLLEPFDGTVSKTIATQASCTAKRNRKVIEKCSEILTFLGRDYIYEQETPICSLY